MTAAQARLALRHLAVGVAERDRGAAVARLLERLATRDDAEELRAALVVAGAAAVLRDAEADS